MRSRPPRISVAFHLYWVNTPFSCMAFLSINKIFYWVIFSWNWCFWTVVLEKTLESPLDFKEIQPVHSKGDQSWVFFGKNDAEAETPVLWPPHAKSWLIGKDLDAGRDWGQEKKGTTEDEMAGWHHWLDGREFEWTPGVGDGQGGLACCDSWGRKSRTRLSDWSELNWFSWKEKTVFSPVNIFHWTGGGVGWDSVTLTSGKSSH